MGEQLVERSGRASRLTEAGEVVAAHAQRVLDTLEGMHEELRALHAAERGTLRAWAASTTPGSYVLPSTCSASTAAPARRRRCRHRLEGLGRERVAAATSSEASPASSTCPDGHRAQPSLDDEVVGIAAPGKLKLHRSRATVSQPVAQTLLAREHGSSTRAVSERFLARAGYRPAKRWELDSSEAIKRSVAAGLGIGFVSELVVADEVRRGELVRFRLESAETMRRCVTCCAPMAASQRRRSGRSSRPCARAAQQASPVAVDPTA